MSTSTPEQSLPALSARPLCLSMPLHDLLQKPPVSSIPSGTEVEARTSFALSLPPSYPHRLKLVHQIAVPHIAAFLSGQIYFSVVLLALWFTCPAATRASELTKPTAEAFRRYVQRTEARMQSELADPEHFLYFDSLPEQRRNAILTRLHNGQVVIEQMQTDGIYPIRGVPRSGPDILIKTVMALLTQHGYDGAAYMNRSEHFGRTRWIIFDPKQYWSVWQREPVRPRAQQRVGYS